MKIVIIESDKMLGLLSDHEEELTMVKNGRGYVIYERAGRHYVQQSYGVNFILIP